MNKVVQLHTPAGYSAAVHRIDLVAALEILKRVTPPKSSIPILDNVRLLISAGTLTISATNLDMEIAYDIPVVTGDCDFDLTLPAAALSRIVKAGTSELVHISQIALGAESASIDMGESSITLATLDPNDFPSIAIDDKAKVNRVRFPGSVLWNAIDGTIPASSTDEARYYLAGTFIHADEGKVVFVATDGHRLYRQRTNITAPKSLDGVILPAASATILARAMSAARIPLIVDAVFMPRVGLAIFVFDQFRMITKLVDGTFPDYRRVLPSAPDKIASLSAKVALQKLKLVTVHDNTSAVELRFWDNVCRLSASTPSGRSSLPVPCTYQGEEFSIGFRPDYLSHVIEKASPDGGPVEFRFTDAGSPTIVSGTLGGWSAVIMPVRV